MKIGVLKVGGGLLSSDEHKIDEQIELVVKEVRRMLGHNDAVWVVQSATGGTTRHLDKLCDIAETTSNLEKDVERLVSHHQALGLGGKVLLTTDISSMEISAVNIESALKQVLRDIHDYGDEKKKRRAFVQSMGERMAVELVMMPALSATRVKHFPAFDFVHAYLSKTGFATNVRVDVQKTSASLRGVIESLCSAMVDTDRKFPAEGEIGVPRVFLMEGFVARCDDHIATLGYDGSDTSAIVAAYAFETEAVLLKDIKGTIDFGSTEELLEHMISVAGDKGKLVGVQALEIAVKYGVTILLRDPNTGYEHRLEPRAKQTKVISMT